MMKVQRVEIRLGSFASSNRPVLRPISFRFQPPPCIAANQLRFQQSGCPICRQSFRALLQIRAVRKKVPNSLPAPPNSSSIPEETVDDDAQSVDSTGRLRSSSLHDL